MAFKRPHHPCLDSVTGLQAILIDAGGVLLDDNRPWLLWQRQLVKLLQDRNIAVTLCDVRSIAKRAAQSLAPRISWEVAHHFGCDEKLFRDSWAGLSIGDPVVGAHEILLRLRKLRPLALVANQAADARDLLREHELEKLFDVIVLSEEVGVSKPDHRIFLQAVNALGVSPERSLMIGDRIDADITPARQLGLLTIRVKSGPYYWQQPSNQASVPHLTLGSLEAASRWLLDKWTYEE